MMYDLCIVGGGPAGVAAGVYAARKQLKTVFIAKEFGGQSVVSDEIQNWIGTEKIPGTLLAKNLEKHLRTYAGEWVEIHDTEGVENISLLRQGSKGQAKSDKGFIIKTDKNTFETKTILIATGSSRRKLPVPDAEKFDGRGITYCASCDGPLFAGQDVAVIGAGNAAFETCAQLLAYAKSVTLLVRNEIFKADEITVNKVLSHPNIKVIKNAVVVEVLGDKFVGGLIYENVNTKERTVLNVTGIFVEIGAMPSTSFVKDLLPLNQYGSIPVDPKNQRTNVDGIWAAGDATDGLYHQNNIAAGDAVKALEDIYLWLRAK